MSVNDKTENRGTHGVSSSMLDTLVSSSENPLSLDMGSVNRTEQRKAPLFQVWQDGKPKMETEHKSCIYPLPVLLRMKAAGCTFKMEGKRYVPKKGE